MNLPFKLIYSEKREK